MMQRRLRGLTAGLLLWIAATASAAPPPLPEPLTAALAAADAPIARVDVPEPSRRVGEVRVHRHGTVRIVQTMLYTKLLERVVAEIARKEAVNWPPERAGHADAKTYIAALREAAAMIPKPKAGDRTVDRRRKLLIEFVIDDDPAQISHHGGAETRSCPGRQPGRIHAGRDHTRCASPYPPRLRASVVQCSAETSGIAAVVFSGFEAEEIAGDVRLTQRRPLLWLALSRDYVATNVDLIVADSFHLDAAGVAALWAKGSGGGDEAGGATK